MTGLISTLQRVIAQRATELAIRQAAARQGYAIEKALANQLEVPDTDKIKERAVDPFASNPNAGVVQAFPNGRYL